MTSLLAHPLLAQSLFLPALRPPSRPFLKSMHPFNRPAPPFRARIMALAPSSPPSNPHIDPPPDVASTSITAPQSGFHRLGRFLNVSSRWIVVAVVIAVVVWKHDDQVLWAVTGGILNAGLSKLLKKIFNQKRPLTALGLKADPGMPSSHAQSLGYLSLYAALGLISWQGLDFLIGTAAAMIILCAACLAWLRISQGLHTPAQVIVGAGFGCTMACLWIGLWHLFIQKAVTSSVTAHYSLYCIFGFVVICFTAFGIRKWRLGDA